MSPWDVVGWLVVVIIVVMLVVAPIAFVVVARHRHAAMARIAARRSEVEAEALDVGVSYNDMASDIRRR